MLQTSANTDSSFTERQELPFIAIAAVDTNIFTQEWSSAYLDHQLDSLSNSTLTQIQ